MALEVIGAGFGRTGTTSLKMALEQLGYLSCHHMQETLGRPEQLKAWCKVAIEGTGDWDKIFEGFRASVDWPSCAYYKALMQHFPEAKVILTVRDPESWYRSTRETVYEATRSVPAWLERIPRVRMIVKKIFTDHTEEVRKNVPRERLLVYSVREGWGPLCEFLGVPAPGNMPFPHENERAQVRRTIRALKLAAVLPYALGVALLVWVGISLA